MADEKTTADSANVESSTIVLAEVYPIKYDNPSSALQWDPVQGATSYSIMTSDDPNTIPPDPSWTSLGNPPTNFLPIPKAAIKKYVSGRANTGGSWGRPSQVPH